MCTDDSKMGINKLKHRQLQRQMQKWSAIRQEREREKDPIIPSLPLSHTLIVLRRL